MTRPSDYHFDWNDASIARLREMWLGGATSYQIADALGTRTRNVVIGKLHRLGLMGSGRVSPPEPIPPVPAVPAPEKGSPWTPAEVSILREIGPVHGRRAVAERIGRTPGSVSAKAKDMGLSLAPGGSLPLAKKVAAPAPVPVEVEDMLCVPLVELSAFQCKWVVGEPKRDGGALYCGLPVERDTAWCSAHRHIVYVAGSARKPPSVVAPARAWAVLA